MAPPLIPIALGLIRIAGNPAVRVAIYTACQVGGKQILKHAAKSGVKRAAKSAKIIFKNPKNIEKYGRRVFEKYKKNVQEQKNTIGANKLERSPQSEVLGQNSRPTRKGTYESDGQIISRYLKFPSPKNSKPNPFGRI